MNERRTVLRSNKIYMKQFFIFLLACAVSAFSFAQAPSNGLLHYYSFDNTLTGSGGHTLAGGTANYTNDRFGNSNRAHNLAAAANAFSSAGIPSLPTASASPRSFCFWYKSNSNSTHSLFNYGGANNFFGAVYDAGQIQVVSGNGSGGSIAPITHNITYTGNWTHVAVTYSGTQLALYVNGALTNTANFGLFNITPSTSRLGYSPFGTYFGNYQIDDLFFYNRVLTAQEVTTLYEFCNAPSSTTPSANLNICSGNSTTLSLSTTTNVIWYDALTGGNVVGTGAPFTTPVLNANTTYYAQTGNCSNRLGIIVNVTVANSPVNTTTTANQNIVCGATTTLTATGTNLTWHDAPTGGNQLGTGGSFTTPALTTNTTYYVQASSGSCVSARTAVAVTVTNPAPTATNSNVNYCYIVGGNNLTILQVAAGPGTVSWYSLPTGGSVLGTGNSFTTPTFADPAPAASYTLNYYAERTTPCGTSARTTFTITVKKRPAAPTSTTPSANLNICSGATTVLSVASTPLALEWYEVGQFPQPISTSSTYTTNALSQATSYEVFAYENGCGSLPPLTLTVNVSTPPSAPTNTTTTQNQQTCVGQSAFLSASGTGILEWFNVATGGTVLGTGSTFITPSLNQDSTFYVRSNNNGCLSSRTAILVTVLPLPAVPTSNTPSANLTVCQGSGTTLSVVNPGAGFQVNWWNVPTGTATPNLLGSGTSINIPTSSLSSNATFYVDMQNLTTGCVSATRLPIAVTVVAPPAAPTNTTPSANLSVCQGNSTVLTASGSGTLEWFADPTGGSPLATGNSYTTPVLQNGAAYFVASKVGNCSSTRTQIGITVNVVPNAPTNTTPTANLTRCSGQTTTLSASTTAAAAIVWYNVATGGTSIFTGTSFTTPVLNADSTYYAVVRFVSTGCESTRLPIAITVNATPTAAITPATVTICEGASANLTASGGGTYAWSNSLGSGAAKTVTPTTSTTYTVTVTSANNCSATASRLVTVNTNPTAAITPATASICNGASQALTASGGGTYVWSNSGGSNAQATFAPTTSTTYTVTVTAANNCSATASRLVTVNTVTASINGPTTICSGLSATLTASGGTSYAWSNSGGTNAQATFTPTANTTYTVTVTDANGCSATASQSVSVQSAPTASISGPTEVCLGSSVTLTANGGNTYEWSNSVTVSAITVSPTTNTTYTVTVSIGANCSATASQTVAVKQPTSFSFSETICFGGSYTFDAQTLTQSGNYTKIEVNSAGCDSVITLQLTVLPELTSSFNVSICDGSAYTFGNQTLTTAGTYNEVFISINGCDSTVTLTLGVEQPLQITQQPTASSTSVCAGESVTLNVTATGDNLSYQWKDGNANVGTNSNSYTATNLTPGTKTYTVAASNACGSETSNDITITVNALPAPTITQSGNTLSTQTFNSYQWQLNGSDISGATTQNFTATQSGSYAVRVTDANGCSNTSAALSVTVVGIENVSAEMNFNVYPNPTSEILVIVCDELVESVEVYNVAGEQVIFVSGEITKIRVSDLAEGTYMLNAKTAKGNAQKMFIKQ